MTDTADLRRQQQWKNECEKCHKPKFGTWSTIASGAADKIQQYYCMCGEAFIGTAPALPELLEKAREKCTSCGGTIDNPKTMLNGSSNDRCWSKFHDSRGGAQPEPDTSVKTCSDEEQALELDAELFGKALKFYQEVWLKSGYRRGDWAIHFAAMFHKSEARAGSSPAPSPERSGIYVASRASLPERSAMWRNLRNHGIKINATWIDEAEENATQSFSELWARIEREIKGSTGLVFYAKTGDFPLKGALVEVGIALAIGIPVIVVAPGVEMNQRNFKPFGSWAKHPLVRFESNVVTACKLAAGVTGNEGKDESRGKDIAMDSGAHSGDRAGSDGAPLPDPLASPAVVTRVCLYGYQWCDGTNRHICEWCIKDLQAKVSELEAQLQQARQLLSRCESVMREFEEHERRSCFTFTLAALERMRAGGKS